VLGAWNEHVPGISPLNILYFKLQRTVVRLRQWSRKLFGNVQIELHMANEIIHRLDMAQDIRDLSCEETLLRKDLKNRVLGLAAVERARRRQVSRVTWLCEGDACTRLFFHLKANCRSNRKFIPYLRKSNGDYAWAYDDKEQILHEHFTGIIGTVKPMQLAFNWGELQLPQLSSQQQLDAPFSELEVKQAIDELPAEKPLARTDSRVSSSGHVGI
jgi:hypothetical protein